MYNDDEQLLAEMSQILDAMNSPWQMKESKVEVKTDCVRGENSHNRESQIEVKTDCVRGENSHNRESQIEMKEDTVQEKSGSNMESKAEMNADLIKKKSHNGCVTYFYALLILIVLAIIPATFRLETLFRVPAKPVRFVYR